MNASAWEISAVKSKELFNRGSSNSFWSSLIGWLQEQLPETVGQTFPSSFPLKCGRIPGTRASTALRGAVIVYKESWAHK